MATNGANPRQGDTDGVLTVADLLRREGVTPTEEIPVVDAVRRRGVDFGGDDTPTVRLMVSDLLRREGELPEAEPRGGRRVAAVAAGVAALFGLAAAGFSAVQLHDGSNPASAGGPGGGTVGPAVTPTTTLTTQPGLLTSSTVALGKVDSAPGSSSETTTSRAAADSKQSGGTAPRTSQPATTTVPATSAPAAPATTTSPRQTTTSAPTTTSTATSSPSSSSPPTTTSPTESGLLDPVTDLIGGLLGG